MLLGREPETLYLRAERHKVVEESLLKLSKTSNSEGEDRYWNKKRNGSDSPTGRDSERKNYTMGNSGLGTSVQDDQTIPIILNTTESWAPTRDKSLNRTIFSRYA